MKDARLLPSKGGALLLPYVIEQSRDDDYIAIALSSEDGRIAEYTHCNTAEQAAHALYRYHHMPEVQEAFVLHRFDIDEAALIRQESGTEVSTATKHARSK